MGLGTGDSFGQAFASSAVTIGVGTIIEASVVTFVLGSNPVGWAAVGVAVGVGVVTTFLYNNNVLGMKDLAIVLAKKLMKAFRGQKIK